MFLGVYLCCGRLLPWLDDTILGVKVLSSEEIDALCQSKEDALIIPEILLNGNRLPYDSEQNMLLIPQSLWEESFSGRLSAVTECKGGVLRFLKDEEGFGNKKEALRSNRVFRLWWISENTCWMYNVYFTGMPVAFITSAGTENGKGDNLGKIEVYDQYHSAAAYQSAECKWHLRGATTRNYEKASYRLSLTSNKLSLLGMRKDDDWILHALYDDDGLIHNKLSYEVWREIAGSNSTAYDEGIRVEYIELFMDNTYLGVYGLSERIDKKALSLGNRDILYKCVDQEPPGEDDFYRELTEEMSPTFELKFPEVFTMEDWEPMRQWSEMFLFGEQFDLDRGKALLDMENAVDYNLFNLLTCGMDNIMKNIYFHADYQGTGDDDYKLIKIPWDLNMTWGNSWIDSYDCNFNCYQEKNLEAPDGWTPDMEKLYECAPGEIGEALCKRWWELRTSVITRENLCGIVDAQYEYLHDSGAYFRNYQKWPPKGDYWQDDYIYQYIDRRITYLDDYIEQLGDQ